MWGGERSMSNAGESLSETGLWATSLAHLVNLFIYCQGACQLCLFIAREVATTTKPSHGLIKIKPVRRPIGGIFVNQIKKVGVKRVIWCSVDCTTTKLRFTTCLSRHNQKLYPSRRTWTSSQALSALVRQSVTHCTKAKRFSLGL